MTIQKLTGAVNNSINQQKTRERLLGAVQGSINQQNAKQKQIGRLINTLKEIKMQKEEDIMDIICTPKEPLLTRIKNKAAEIISLF